MTPAVSVAIPAYRAEATIVRAVRSVLEQPDIEAEVIVVVDDGSTAAHDAVAAIGSHRVRCLMNSANLGAQVSRNRGLGAALAPFVMFLDADDYLEGALLAPLVERMRAAEAQIGFGPWIRREEPGGMSTRHAPPAADAAALFELWMVDKRWTPPCAVLWNADWLRSIGGWDETVRRNQDGELVLRALLAGARHVTSNDGAGVYVQHPSEHRISLSTTNYDSMVDVARKLFAIESDVVPARDRGRIIGEYLYDVARVHFWHAEWDHGRRALALARRMGFRAHRGSPLSRASYHLLGLERQQRLWQGLRARLRGARAS